MPLRSQRDTDNAQLMAGGVVTNERGVLMRSTEQREALRPDKMYKTAEVNITYGRGHLKVRYQGI